jgi:histidyl-tRNA synthetase
MVRAFYESGTELSPWKVFQFGPAFRHERPQKGRNRQFYTCSIEVMNAPSLGHDIAFIAMLNRMFVALGIKDFVLNLNFLGVAEDRSLHRSALREFLVKNDVALCETCRVRRDKNVLRVFDCKNEQCQALYKNAPKLSEYFSENSAAEWARLQKELQLLSVNFILNPMLVRGLDYYNGVVFEFTSNELGSQSTFCGGGRYDLSAALGKKDALPCVGAGVGLERVMMILESQQHPLVTSAESSRLIAIVPMDAAQESLAFQVADSLFEAGLTTEIIFDGAGMKQKMKRADRFNAAFTLVLGDREAAAGVAMVKNMATGESAEVALRDLAAFLQKK